LHVADWRTKAVADHVTGFKNDAFAGRTEQTCALPGSPTTFRDAHVDHVPPATFSGLVTDWLRCGQIRHADISVTPGADNQRLTTMTYARQTESWREFHRTKAVLRIVCGEANNVGRAFEEVGSDPESALKDGGTRGRLRPNKRELCEMH
jgi:hypothetical protein